MNQEKIGAFLARLRREKGYTQREVANRLELSEKTISKWECGKGLPEVVYMEPLSSLLGISVNELLAGERIPILALIRKMDETRIELVTQLSFEQLTVFSVRTDEKRPDPGNPCGRDMKRNSDTDSPHSFGLSVLFRGVFPRENIAFPQKERDSCIAFLVKYCWSLAFTKRPGSAIIISVCNIYI